MIRCRERSALAPSFGRVRAATAYPSSIGCAIRLFSNDIDASTRRGFCTGCWGACCVTGLPGRVLDRLHRLDEVPQLREVQRAGPVVQTGSPDRERPAEDAG